MRSYENTLRDQMASMLDVPGSVADVRSNDICAAIYAMHLWDPAAINVEVLRVNVMKLEIEDWADRNGDVPVDQLGWASVLSFVEQLGPMDSAADRDWTTGDITLQHVPAIPVRFDYVDSVRRLSGMLGDHPIEPLELMSRLLNLYYAFIEDFGRRNNHPLEILTGDMADDITGRASWEPEWAFAWPTYHGMVGVFAYNDWVAQSPELEWTLARVLLDEA
ncbi:hypothetical protein L5G32_17225 [Gordonia sp. HY002]|nr:hypothetical protein [Gordonia zhenghanii]MCF8572012.1 hypothetical protein [Gordonia zhenghanii]MCF8606643.1 hypothetical protein [Gordonia zhenghanii]